MTGHNIGDLLDDAGVTWGWFQGGFDLTVTNANGTTGCARSTHSAVTERRCPRLRAAPRAVPVLRAYRESDACAAGVDLRRRHGHDTIANHQYDVHDFFAAVASGNFPAVSFLKAPAYENGHAGNSDPLDEQRFVVEVINFLQQQPAWRETAVIIAYDDSDGWYDHQMAPTTNASFDSVADQLNGPGTCGVRGQDAAGPRLARRSSGERTLRTRHASAVARHLAVGARQLRRPHADHSVVHHSLRRRQLARPQTHRRGFVRRNRRKHRRHVRLHRASAALATLPRSRARRRRRGAARSLTMVTAGRVAAVSIAAVVATCAMRASHASHEPREIANAHPVRLVRPAVAPLSAVALLGRSIFFDAALSGDGRRSCATCHQPENAYAPADTAALSRIAPRGAESIVRAVPSLRYVYRTPPFSIGPELSDVDEPPARVAAADTFTARGGLFWDGRANTLQDQAMGPLLNPEEMANRDVASVAAKLRHASYAARFAALFGNAIFSEPGRLVDEAMFAVARFEIEDPSFHPYDSKYDLYLEGRATLTPQEWRGLQVFDDPKRGNCAACHRNRRAPTERLRRSPTMSTSRSRFRTRAALRPAPTSAPAGRCAPTCAHSPASAARSGRRRCATPPRASRIFTTAFTAPSSRCSPSTIFETRARTRSTPAASSTTFRRRTGATSTRRTRPSIERRATCPR